MNKLMMFFAMVLVGASTGVAIFGQDVQKGHPRTAPAAERTQRDGKAFGFRGVAASIAAADRASYYMGFDFEDAKHLIEEQKAAEAIIAAAYLWDSMSDQPEAKQIEAVLRMLVRGEGTPLQQIGRLETAQSSYETRLKGNRKWFYDLGKNYGQLFAYLCFGKTTSFKGKLTEIGKMGNTAPAGTPRDLVAALVKLGEYGAKESFSDDDVAAIGVQFGTIEKQLHG